MVSKHKESTEKTETGQWELCQHKWCALYTTSHTRSEFPSVQSSNTLGCQCVRDASSRYDERIYNKY